MLFIVGNSRSGTTMLGRVFGQHSACYTFGELHFFENQVDARTIRERCLWSRERLGRLLERLFTTARKGFFESVSSGEFSDEVARVLGPAEQDDPIAVYERFLQYETTRMGKVVPCEQTPRYLFFVGEILSAFPEAKVVNMIRDPRDVLLSQKHKWRRRMLGARNIPVAEALRAWTNYHPYMIARLWLAAVRTADCYTDHPRFKSVRFEDLLANPQRVVRDLCEFADLPFEEGMLAVPQVGSSTGMDRPDRLGIEGGRAGAWRKGGLSTTEIDICQRVAGAAMREHGYSCEAVRASALRRHVAMLQFGLKGLAALMLNLKRTRNLRETLKRRLAS